MSIAGVTADRFEIRDQLGTGAMGVVYRVFDRELGREVALKVLHQYGDRDIFRFKREFRAIADLAHPNLVALHELFTAGGEWMFTMELVIGEPFRDRMRPGGSLDVARVLDALPQLADGLCALHAAGKVHRDLKPSNVLVQADGRVVILDFGLLNDLAGDYLDRTHESAAIGTAGYMSPEQAADRPVSPASDWYAVGAMLYEVLTGRRPFDGPPPRVLAAKQQRDPAHVLTVAPDVPEPLAELCMALLAREPLARMTGADLLEELGHEVSPWTQRIIERASKVTMVGREPELAALRVALADSRDHCVSLLLLGPCGSGKTTLMEAFAAEARAAGAVVLRSRASQREQAVPLRGVDTFVDELSRYLMSLPPDEVAPLIPEGIELAARVFSGLRRVPAARVPLPPGSLPATDVEIRRQAFVVLVEVVRRIAARHPTVIFADDNQWGTAEGAQLINTHYADADAPRTLLVFAHRDEGGDTPLLELLRQWPGPDQREIRLDPLPAALPELPALAPGAGS